MEPRRRFFPAKTVQTVPGRTVELEMQLRSLSEPVAAPAPSAPPGETDLLGAGWLLPTLADHVPLLSYELLPDGRHSLKDPEDWGLLNSIWAGEPVFEEEGIPRPIPGPGFQCVEVSVMTNHFVAWPGFTYFGVLQATTSTDVYWELEWSHPSLHDPLESDWGNKVQAYGNVVQVQLMRNATGMSAEELLTARAFSGGVQVAELRLIAIAIAT